MHSAREEASRRVGFADGSVEWFDRLAKAVRSRAFEANKTDPVIAEQFLNVLRVVEDSLIVLRDYQCRADDVLSGIVQGEIDLLNKDGV